MASFANVVLPHTRLDTLTYRVTDEQAGSVKVGSAVRVELVRKPIAGIVVELGEKTEFANPKPILEVIEPEFCNPGLLKLTQWVSQYYASSWGEALTIAFPGKVIGYRPRKQWELPPASAPSGTAPTLTLDQSRVTHRVLASLKPGGFKPYLLFGVTGSGKTEIYLRAAEEVTRLGKSVIVLVPEIALTPLLIGRFEERFPGRIVALHSGLRDAERKKYWQALRDGRIKLVVGARSAVFAPVRDLGLIVVDEEHDPSYKEHERSPHFNARDVAVMRAKQENTTVVLASATPSLESFYNAQRGAYELLQLPRRIADRPLPKATIVSVRTNRSSFIVHRSSPATSSPFSAVLTQAIKSRMGTDEQMILFVNRRGFSKQVTCRDCGHVPVCKYCGVPLVYHADRRNLQCHFCKTVMPGFDTCPQCTSHNLDYEGVGTQQTVQALRRLVPGATVLRMDSDTTAKPDACREILDAFGQGRSKFLVGTQMVTKGFDFPKVTLSAVVSADSLLNMPDFRAAERTFQVLTQVAGRAGRGDKPGQAVFQTLHPNHHAIVFAAAQNYVKFYEREIEVRRELSYPPFSRLALIRIMSTEAETCEKVGELLKGRFVGQESIQVLGPIPAYRKKKRNIHIYLLMLKAPRNLLLSKVIDRKTLSFPRVRVDLDIDPLEIM
jgi:primosomal protein N' (replication factor Y)